MATPTATEFKQITQQLYQKNLDLVNANKELALIQKLYEIMSTTFTINEVAQKAIETTVKDLNLLTGSIALKDKTKQRLVTIATTRTQFYQRAFQLIGKPLPQLQTSLTNHHNLLVKTYHTKKPHLTHDLFDILTPVVDKKTANKITQLSQTKSTLIYPLYFGKKRLGVFTISLNTNAKNLNDTDKKILHRISTVLSIAIDRVTIYQDLHEANKQLKVLDKLKNEFVSVASHELRTPMTAIKSYLWMILNKKQPTDAISDKTKIYLDHAYNSTERLISLVNDMLDVSRIESGKVEFNPAQFNISDLISEVKDEVSAKATENQLQVAIGSPPDASYVWADKDKIHEVLLNLVGNSLKFTPPNGQITVSTKHHQNMVEISVIDTGKGISKEDIPKLFTKFGRLEGGSLTSMAMTKGTGLGLYICKQYIEKQGGKIWVESELGKGTTFIFTLPTNAIN